MSKFYKDNPLLSLKSFHYVARIVLKTIYLKRRLINIFYRLLLLESYCIKIIMNKNYSASQYSSSDKSEINEPDTYHLQIFLSSKLDFSMHLFRCFVA